MSDTSKMTAAVYERLKIEIEELEGQGRREKAERIGIAREWGDLKENAEYHAAKDDAAMLEAKIARLRDQLRSAEIVEATEGGDSAGMGSTVTLTDEGTGKESSYRLVPAFDAKPADGLLSIDSPMGRVLAGSKAGDKRTLETPRGSRSIRVDSVEHL